MLALNLTLIFTTLLAALPLPAIAGNLCLGPTCPTIDQSALAGAQGWGFIHDSFGINENQVNREAHAAIDTKLAGLVAATTAILNKYSSTQDPCDSTVRTDDITADRASMLQEHYENVAWIKSMEALLDTYRRIPRGIRTARGGDDAEERSEAIETYKAHFARMKNFFTRPIGELVCIPTLKLEISNDVRANGPAKEWRRTCAQRLRYYLRQLADININAGPAPAFEDRAGQALLRDLVWVEGRRLDVFDREFKIRGKAGYERELKRNGLKFAKTNRKTKGVDLPRTGVRNSTKLDKSNPTTDPEKMFKLTAEAKDGRRFEKYLHKQRHNLNRDQGRQEQKFELVDPN